GECPAEYPVSRKFHDKLTDERSCAPCECGPPTGAWCMVEQWLFSNATCGAAYCFQQSDLNPGEGLCMNQSKTLGSVWANLRPPNVGRGERSTSNSSGSVERGAWKSFCCKQ